MGRFDGWESCAPSLGDDISFELAEAWRDGGFGTVETGVRITVFIKAAVLVLAAH